MNGLHPAFSSLGDWLAMGGHGPYVWTAWGLTLLAVVAVSLYLPHERRRFWRDEAARQRRHAMRQQVRHHEEENG